MADLNLCVFIGRVGRDPELKHFPSSGDPYCSASIAVGKKWKDKNSGEMREQTTWVPLQFFNKTAELFAKYAKKGSQIRVNGEFTTRKYNDKDGVERTATEIRVQDFQLLGGKPEGSGDGGQQQAPAQRQAAAPKASAGGGGDFDDDIPFAPLGHGASWSVI